MFTHQYTLFQSGYNNYVLYKCHFHSSRACLRCTWRRSWVTWTSWSTWSSTMPSPTTRPCAARPPSTWRLVPSRRTSSASCCATEPPWMPGPGWGSDTWPWGRDQTLDLGEEIRHLTLGKGSDTWPWGRDVTWPWGRDQTLDLGEGIRHLTLGNVVL